MILDNIWVINLNKSTNRLKNITDNLNGLGLSFNRFSAIYGKELTNDEINENTNYLCRKLLCNHGIVGCAMSHRKLWQQLIDDNNATSYLILEDDVILNQTSVDLIKKLDDLQVSENIDIISLYGKLSLKHKPIHYIDDITVGTELFPITTTAYMITKSGAQKMLSSINKITYHIDIEMAIKTYFNGIKYYVTNPYIVDTVAQDTTLVTYKETILLKLIKYFNNKLPIDLSSPSLVINMKYEITQILIIYLLLFYLNYKYIKSSLLFVFLIFEILMIIC
jgi:glycosyl transferase family 25